MLLLDFLIDCLLGITFKLAQSTDNKEMLLLASSIPKIRPQIKLYVPLLFSDCSIGSAFGLLATISFRERSSFRIFLAFP